MGVIHLTLLCLSLMVGWRVEGRVYSRGYRSSPPETDCPAQCRCISLSLLGYRDMAQRWQSMGQLNGRSNPVWKGTEAPVWEEDSDKLQGRDVVCMGLTKIPRPLPKDATKLTMYGDSSDVDAGSDPLDSNYGTGSKSQLTFIRDSSFHGGGALKQLTISGNNISILYPYIFRGLDKLENIAMQNNDIRHISAAAFYGLERLIELRLSDNQIAYLSPHVFASLNKLRFLYLNGNKLTSVHRDLFSNLATVEYLDISRNNFSDFYDTVFDGAVNVRELLINENRLWVIRARWFKNLGELKRLEIQGNLITQINPSSFTTLLMLEELSLSANIINTVSDEAFRNLTMLKVLNIGANDISRLEPDCLAGLDSLDELDLSVNRLSFIDNKTFDATPKLTKLYLSKNSIKDIEEAALHSLKALEELDLSNNKLRKIKSKTFTGLLEMKELNLEHNLISTIEDDAFVVAPLNQLSMITWLNLQYNRIRKLTAYSLFGLPHLKFLNIGHNRIQAVDKKSFNTLGSLQNVLLNNNRIRKIEDETFARLKQLYSLTLEGNKLTSLTDDMFLGLSSLDDLNIVLNAVERISPNAFRHFPKLTRLDLNTNKISDFQFSDLILLKNLGFLDISKNRLYTLNFTNEKTHDLRHLILTNNNLRTLSADVTNILSSAGVIALSENPWLCDCHLRWIQRHLLEYRIRLVGRRDTICQTPSAVHKRRVDSLTPEEFKCDNRTTTRQLACDYVQIREDSVDPVPLRKGKNEARKWHVMFQDKSNPNSSCNGMLLGDNWAVTRQSCMVAHVPTEKSQIKVKVGHRSSRDVLLTMDYPNNSSAVEFDIRLVRLAEVPKTTKPVYAPCILTHTQYHSLARAVAEVGFSIRMQDANSGKFKTRVRTGRAVARCEENTGICVNVRGKLRDIDLQGSPLSLRYQGIWYSAGLGVHVNSTEYTRQRFTPLWGVTGWMEQAISEIDTKCQFQTDNTGRRTLCEGLDIPGVVATTSFE